MDPAATLGFVQLTGGDEQVQPPPSGGVMETSVVFAGVASPKVAAVAATEPVLVTTCVYVMFLPATTGFGAAEFVNVSSACAVVPTTVAAVAVLLVELGSLVDELAVEVSVITVPFAVPEFTLTTIEKVAAVLAAWLSVVQITFPVFPEPGPMQVQPAGAEMENRVVFAGMASTRVELSAALGPLLVITWV